MVSQELKAESDAYTRAIKYDFIFKSLALGKALVAAKHGLYLVDNHQECNIASKSLVATGEYCEGELETLTSLNLENKALIEICSNIGEITVPLAKYFKGNNCKIFAYEFIENSYYLLCANLALNGVENVTAYREGAICPAKNNYISKRGINNSGKFNLSNHRDEFSGSLESSFDYQFNEIDKPYKIGLIKIGLSDDVFRVLMSVKHFMNLDRPYLYINNPVPKNSPALLSYVKSMNYKLYWDMPFIITEDNYFGAMLDMSTPRLIGVNILGVPLEMVPTLHPKLKGLAEVDDLNWHPLSGLYSEGMGI